MPPVNTVDTNCLYTLLRTILHSTYLSRRSTSSSRAPPSPAYTPTLRPRSIHQTTKFRNRHSCAVMSGGEAFPSLLFFMRGWKLRAYILMAGEGFGSSPARGSHAMDRFDLPRAGGSRMIWRLRYTSGSAARRTLATCIAQPSRHSMQPRRPSAWAFKKNSAQSLMSTMRRSRCFCLHAAIARTKIQNPPRCCLRLVTAATALCSDPRCGPMRSLQRC